MCLKNKYQNEGYCVVKNAVPSALLTRLDNMAKALENKALALSSELDLEQAAVDSLEVPTTVFRINHVYRTEAALVNQLLSSPKVYKAIVSLGGGDIIPLGVDINFKSSHVAAVVPWHQDSIHDGTAPYFAMGVYLDDADENDGCLRYLPGSHKQKQDVHQLASQHGWNIPQHQQVPVAAGDVLFHDVMTLHGSTPKVSPGARRTIYVEFRPAKEILATGSQSENWVNLRKRWMALLHAKAIRMNDSDMKDDSHVKELPSEFYQDLYANREKPTPSNWAFPSVKREDYP